jgi:hypothetical protein
MIAELVEIAGPDVRLDGRLGHLVGVGETRLRLVAAKIA